MSAPRITADRGQPGLFHTKNADSFRAAATLVGDVAVIGLRWSAK
jgi:hypothetical protein